MRRPTARPWPAGFALTPSLELYARMRHFDPAAEFKAWRHLCLARGATSRDWAAAWRLRVDRLITFCAMWSAEP